MKTELVSSKPAPRRPVPGPDHVEVVDALSSVDPRELGSRIRKARREQGLTQAAACADIISTAYLSRIESGDRRPDVRVLHTLAERLGSSAHELLLGLTPAGWSTLEVEHDWAQLSLRTGDPEEALQRTSRILAEAPANSRLAARATVTHALALEAAGSYDEAAMLLEGLVESDAAVSLEVLTALARVYRETGEIGRAIQIGDRANSRLAELQMEGSPAAIRLSLTVAAAYADNGDVGYALRMCTKALRAADELGNPSAKAGCYWNASIFESQRGNQDEAVELARRALWILDDAESTRHAANLRTQLGILLLRVEPPEINEALGYLSEAEMTLANSDSSPADLADNRLAQGRAHFLSGNLDRARGEAERVLNGNAQGAPLMTAEAHVLLGQVAFNHGDHERARNCYQQAIMALTAVGADRAAAQLWFELGGLWQSIGCTEEALDALQRAGVSTGLRATPRAQPSVRSVSHSTSQQQGRSTREG